MKPCHSTGNQPATLDLMVGDTKDSGSNFTTCKELTKHRKASGRLTFRAGRTTCDNTQAASLGSVVFNVTNSSFDSKLPETTCGAGDKQPTRLIHPQQEGEVCFDVLTPAMGST